MLEFALEPIKRLLLDRETIEILLNPDGLVWSERLGEKMSPTQICFTPVQAELLLREIAAAVKVQLTDERPSLACRLPVYGARVQGLLPPVVSAPTFNFRKPAAKVFSLAHYVELGILTASQGSFLADAVASGLTILVGGGTGSGKTTLTNALLRELVHADERILIVEDNVELQCPVRNTTAILVRAPEYTWKHAVMDALRMRPDRIIIGELRDGVALDFLKAANTGHPGSIATVHANSTREMLDRMCLLIEEVIPAAPREMVAATVQLCVHIQRDRRHPAGRSITGIDRVLGYDFSARRWQLEPVAA
jgi:type IV secretion system protein VirB11